MIIAVKVVCILLQTATLCVGALMATDKNHTNEERLTGVAVATLAIASAVVISAARF